MQLWGPSIDHFPRVKQNFAGTFKIVNALLYFAAAFLYFMRLQTLRMQENHRLRLHPN